MGAALWSDLVHEHFFGLCSHQIQRGLCLCGFLFFLVVESLLFFSQNAFLNINTDTGAVCETWKFCDYGNK